MMAHMTGFTMPVGPWPVCVAALAIAMLMGGAAGARGATVERFPELPDSIRSRILTGAPRTSREIPESSFGVHTTLLRERGRADGKYQEELVDAIVKGGYTWVVDYISWYDHREVATADLAVAMRDYIPPMVQYAALLKAHGVNLLIRLDVPNWAAGPKTPPTDDDSARARAFLTPIIEALSPYCNHWQYHNEPNFPKPEHSRPHTPPEVYVAWLRLVEGILRDIQPDAVYSGPATAMLQCIEEEPYPWVRLAFEAGLGQPIQQLSYHPYRFGAGNRMDAAVLPEHPSAWTGTWDSYYHQIDGLKAFIREHNGGVDIPLIVTEDGLSTFVDAQGEQGITEPVHAKYELRRMLQDNWLDVNPRATFILFRGIEGVHSEHYDFQTAFNMMTYNMKGKPIYYAAQNLMAVLDSTYRRNDDIDVTIELETPPTEGTAKLVRTEADATGITHGGMEGMYLQTYTKSHDDFDELLVFFWSAEESGNLHVRREATLTLHDTGWIAPLEIDLMAMPNPRLTVKQTGRDDLINPECPDRLQPRPLAAELKDGSITLPVEVRDYPLLIKWVRMKDDSVETPLPSVNKPGIAPHGSS
jgi:hypothetical protein